jgi:hypothetical protein
MTIIDLQTKRQERARATAHKMRHVIRELPSIAYVAALEQELLAERALGQVSADLLQECESVLRQCRGLS